MTMYDELVQRLRRCSQFRCRGCEYENITPCRTKLNDEAADAIEELSKVLDTVNDAHNEGYDVGYWAGRRDYEPKWIPVTEQLPEEDGEYLTWFRVDDSEPSFGIFPFDANVPAFGYWDEYYDPVTYGWAGSDFIEVKGVTHWMPLPTPPKEET